MGLNIFDQFTYLHFSTGIVAYFFGLPLLYWIVLHTIFEITENTSFGINMINNYFKFWPGGKPYSDSFVNCVGDTLGTVIGWFSAYLIDNLGSKYKLYEAHL